MKAVHSQCCRLSLDEVGHDDQLTLAKLRRSAGLSPVTLEDGPSLGDSWLPDAGLEKVLGRLRAGDPELVALDLSVCPDGDFLALALAAGLAGNTTLASLQLRACGFGIIGLSGLASWLATNSSLTTLGYVVALLCSFAVAHAEGFAAMRSTMRGWAGWSWHYPTPP